MTSSDGIGPEGSKLVMYEDLAEIEKQFEDVEVNLLRHNYILTQPIYAERAKLVRRIPYFWAIVIEEAPEEIDRRIQPCDTAVLSSLQRVEVTRFEISPEAPEAGEPRSVKIAFFFGENAWFEDRVLEKCFWYRTGKDGWTGLVSDPVQIHWKEGKDLTEGLLDEAVNVFKTDAEIKRYPDQVQSSLSKGQSKQNQLSEMIRVHKSLVQRLVNHLRNTPQDAVSFFAWFGYRGRDISAGVSAEAMRKEVRKRKLFKDEGTSTSGDDIVVDNYEDEPKDSEAIATSEFEGKELDFEIFPAGEELAVAISEDLYPGAIKYFTQAQEKDATESDEEEEASSGSGNGSESTSPGDEPAVKRLKTAA